MGQPGGRAGVVTPRGGSNPAPGLTLPTELMQYERRFRELYQQLASKSEETKRYYDQYNLLGEKQGYLTKEASLINSIHDNFMKVRPTASRSMPPPHVPRSRRLLRLRCLHATHASPASYAS